MNRLFKISIFLLGVFGVVLFNACSDDIDPEVTEITTSRLFSPTDISIRILEKTIAEVSWKGSKAAESYEVQVFENNNASNDENDEDAEVEADFSGTPVVEIKGLTMQDSPYEVLGLAGETNYAIRIKAVGKNVGESFWTSETFKTDAEQILTAIADVDIEATSVVIRWKEGEVATNILITPGDINHAVTAEEIEAGAATITGLSSDTEHTVTLMNGEKARGVRTFKTTIDVGDAIVVSPGDDLATIIAAASEGDAFALMPGTYEVKGNVAINTSISIVGVRPNDRPVIVGAVIRMKSGVGLEISNVVFDGTESPDGNQAIVYDEDLPDGTYGDLLVENSEFFNYTKGLIYVNKNALIESVTYRNNIIHDIECAGGDFIDFRVGMTKKFEFVNNTVYNSALGRDLIRMDAGGSTNFPTEISLINVVNNTFYNVVGTDSRRIVYVRLASHEITVSKNIFAKTLANYSNQSATNVVSFVDNNYYEAPNLTSDLFTVHDSSGSYTTLDPGFTNVDNGNFTVTQSDLKYDKIGDPRWVE